MILFRHTRPTMAKRRPHSYCLTVFIAALFAASAVAESSGGNLAQKAKDRPSELVGRTVVDNREREVGEVQSVVVAKQDCKFYLVLSSDQFLGLGDDDVIVPVTAVSRTGEHVVLSSSEEVEPYIKDGYLIVQEDD